MKPWEGRKTEASVRSLRGKTPGCAMILAKDVCPEVTNRRMAETTLRMQRAMVGSVHLEPMSTEMVEMQTLAALCLISPPVSMAATAVAARFLPASS